VSLEEGEYRSDLEVVSSRLLRAGMVAAFEERIAPELNAAWQVLSPSLLGFDNCEALTAVEGRAT
jgi:hypothetical protein